MTNNRGFSPIKTLRSSFSLKLGALFLIVILLIAGIGGVIYTQTGSALQESTEQNMKQTTELQANTVAEQVDRSRDKTRYLSEAAPLRSGDDAEIREFLQAEQEAGSESIGAIHFYNASSNEVLVSSADETAGTNYEDSDVAWATNGLSFENAQTTHLTDPYSDPVLDSPAIAFASQVSGESDRAVVLVIDLETQIQKLDRPSAAEGSFTHIVNSQGAVVMSHHTHDINTQNMGSDDEYSVESMAVQNGLNGTTGYMEMEPGHGHEGTMTMGYAPVAGTDWVIMTHTPAEEAFALQDEIRQSVLALILVSLVGLGGIGVIVGRNTTRSIRQLAAKAKELEDGNLTTELETGRTDEIGQLYDSFANMRDALREQIREAQQAREEAEQARVETEQMNEHLEAKAADYQAVMESAAEGDLTARMDPESDNESMAQIGRTFNDMLGEIEATTEQLKNFAAEVATASEQVTASSEEVRSASEQVTESIQEISDGAERQNDSLQSVSQEMDGLSTTIEEIASSSNEVADIAEQTADTGREGREAAQQAIEGMNSIEAESKEAVAEIEQLQEEVAQIDELLEFITEVAEQTNMLALNANIEASRSGESGEGFAVVAEEVKELAADTKNAAQDIEDRLEQIKTQTDTTAEEVRRTSSEITEHTDSVREAADALEEIAGYAQETNTGVQEISAATEQQAASTQQVVAIVDEAATISEETTAEAENVAAAAEEQTTALTEVSRSASDLANQASQLSEALDRFDTDADPESGLSELPDEQESALPSAEELAADMREEPDVADEQEADDGVTTVNNDESAHDGATADESADDATGVDDPLADEESVDAAAQNDATQGTPAEDTQQLGDAESEDADTLDADALQTDADDTDAGSNDVDDSNVTPADAADSGPETLNRTEVSIDDGVDSMGGGLTEDQPDKATHEQAESKTASYPDEDRPDATPLGGVPADDSGTSSNESDRTADSDSTTSATDTLDKGVDPSEIFADDGDDETELDPLAEDAAPDPLADQESDDDQSESITLGTSEDEADDAADAGDEEGSDDETGEETDNDMFSFVQSDPENRNSESSDET